MIPVIPKKRKDGKSSFGDLVSYVSVRDEPQDDGSRQGIRYESGHATQQPLFPSR